MVSTNDNNSKVYIATLGSTREERMWNSVDQITSILKDLEEKKDVIEELHLSNNSLSFEVAEALASKIKDLKNLRIVGYNDMFVSRLREETPKSLALLVRALENKNIETLNLSDNAYGPIGVTAFDFYLRETSTLKKLILENNGLGPEGASHVADALKANKNIKLETIRISRNRLENKGATALGEYLKTSTSLKEIAVLQNGIKDEGMTALLEGLISNKDLQVIQIHDNYLGELACPVMLKLLEVTQNLRVIDISDLKIGCDNSVLIFEKLGKIHTIEEIYCNYNEIEEKEAQNSIVTALSGLNNKLKKLSIKGNEIKKSVFKKIKQNKILEDADCYSESEMDEDDLNKLMEGLDIKK